MRRQRLKSRTACLTCLKRRKKCGEERPVCSACDRLDLVCTWRKSQEHRGSNIEISTTIVPKREHERSSKTVEEYPTRVRTPEEIAKHEHIFNTCIGALDRASQLPALDTTFARLFDNHILVMALTTSWDTVKERYLLDDQWDHLIEIDKVMQHYPKPVSSRFASIWLCRIITKVI